MAFADLTAYENVVQGQTNQPLHGMAQAGIGTTGRLVSWWTGLQPFQAVAPTTMATCDRTTNGALGQVNASNSLYLASALTDAAANAALTGYMQLIVADRLVHSGGLSGTSVSTQSLAAASLPRYTSGVGVWAALEIHASLGSTNVNATVSYTNTAGTSGRTGIVSIGASGRNNANTLLPVPYQTGDVGVLSVESVTLSASTLTVGNFGVTLFKPLVAMPLTQQGDPWEKHALNSGLSGLPAIPNNACLQFIGCAGGGSNNPNMLYRFHFADT